MGAGTNRWTERSLLFARNFVSHPKMLGSLIPSSRFLIRRLLRQVDWTRAHVVVEYGPGVGVITTQMLRHMPADGALVAFETNGDFVDYLQRSIDDPRFYVLHASAADVGRVLAELDLGKADYIISGIPYSTMPADVRSAILEASRDVLAPDGRFLVYQFSRAAVPYLRQVFRTVTLDFEPLNVLPASLFYCEH